jgi:pSer/pThr/pTyr-binding forkhead associated (FHA) protein
VELAEDASVPRRTIQVVAEIAQPGGDSGTQVMSATIQMEAQQQSNSRALLLHETSKGVHPIPLETTLLTLGRGLNNDIVLEDARVSRHHAQLRYKTRRFWVTDLGSTNGTFVNGEPVSETALRNGDVLSLGGLELKFREG